MEQATSDNLREVLSRVRRIETRLTRLCMHMNADVLGAKPPILPMSGPCLNLPGLDTTIGECLTFAKANGTIGEISLYHNGNVVGSIVVREGQ
jgi:hypothetical protein